MKRIFLCVMFLLCPLDSFCEKSHEDCLGGIDNIVCIDLYIQNQELFLKHKFFDAVENESTRKFCILLKSTANITNYAPSILIFFLGGGALFERIQIQLGIGDGPPFGMENNEYIFKYATSLIAGFGIGFTAAFCSYKSLSKFINWVLPEKNYNRGSYIILKEFLVNWEKYKICTPEMFHPFFERLYRCYIKGESTESLADLGEVGCVISDRTLKNAAYDIVKHVRLVLDGKLTFSSDPTKELFESIQSS